MKSRIGTVWILLVVFIIAGCTKQEDASHRQGADELVYYAKGENWLATYSLFKVKHSWFDSIYIQYIGDRNAEPGPIEYELAGADFTSSSSYPQQLQGVRSFQTSTESNADLFTLQPTSDGMYKLTIKSKLNTEQLSLRKLTD